VAIVAALVLMLASCKAQENATSRKNDSVTGPNAESAGEVYLEQLQRNSISKLGSPTHRQFSNESEFTSDVDFDRLIREAAASFNLSPNQESEFKKRAIERRERFRNLRPRSQYEDPALYQIIELWSEQIRTAARQNIEPHDLLDTTHVVFGTLPTGEVNAWSIRVPSVKDTYLITFESGFFYFANLMSLAIARTLPIEQANDGQAVLITDPVKVLDNVRQHPELQEAFRQVILAYLVEGRFDTLPASYYTTGNPIRDGVATKLYKGMGLFVLGHEYGHILRGDLAGAGVASVIGGQKVQKIPHEWEQELGADALGIELAYFAMRVSKDNLAAIIVGADFFLHCYEIVEQAGSLIATGDVHPDLAGGNHPPTETRRAWTRQILHAFLRRFQADQVSESDWDAALKEASRFDQLTDQLFVANEITLKRLHDRKIGLAPTWRQRLSESQ
jgi:hypothetical protein